MAVAISADDTRGTSRLAAVDLARGVAIVAMVIYHTAFDLSADGLIATDVIDDLRWKVFARTIAGSFLALVGISLVLATRNGFSRRSFLRRLAFVAGGAVLVSLGTWWFDPSTFVFFGILHEIAVASVLALPFLALPPPATALAGAAALAAPWFLANPAFNHPALWWVGLSTDLPATLDYVPILPWFGAVLVGVVLGRLLVAYGGAIAAWRPADIVSRALMRAGRWSLAIYLIHQPLLVGLLYLVAMVVPPNEAAINARFVGECRAACVAPQRGEGACTALCECMFANLYGTDLYRTRSLGDLTPEQLTRWNGIIDRCNAPPPGN